MCTARSAERRIFLSRRRPEQERQYLPMFPAVKAVGEDLADKIFYLTAKTITGTVAREAFELLRRTWISGKECLQSRQKKSCACVKRWSAILINCPYAKGHYDRVNDAVYDLLAAKEDMYHERGDLRTGEGIHHVCPFEMCLDTATWVG